MARQEREVFDPLTEEKQQSLKRNIVVKARIGRVAVTMGRPKKMSVKKMKNAINKYFEWCEENDRVPSIRGMMLSMKLSRDVFYRYIKDPNYQEILESAKELIHEWVQNDIYQTPGQAAGKIAYAKNIHGWAEKIDTTNVNETTVTQVLDIEQARAKIASLAHLLDPKLLETVSNKYTLNQITTTKELPVIEVGNE